MNTTLFIIAIFVLITLATYLVLDRLTVARNTRHLQRVTEYTQSAPEGDVETSTTKRLVLPVTTRFINLALRIGPKESRDLIADKVRAAGLKTSPRVFLAIKGSFVLISSALAFLFLLAGKTDITALWAIVGAISFIAPDRYLSMRASSRREEMDRALPDTLDLLTVSVEAGLGFDAAVSKVCEKMDGPLIDELKQVSHEMRVGQTRREALRSLSDRVNSKDITTFTRSIIQAEEMGSSLSRTLRVQSQDIRVSRQLFAEEKAMKAPVKMLFPTVLFIFPAMFIVILGPAFLNIIDSLNKL